MKRNGILAGLAVAIAIGGSAGVAFPSSEASASGPKAASLAYVDKAMLPLARKFVRTLRRANPSQKDVTRRTSQMFGMSHRRVTNVTVTVPARGGDYVYAADFRGRVRPRNAVTMAIGMYPARGINGGYDFSLRRTKYDNPGSSLYNEMHWLLSSLYGQRSRLVDHFYDSCSATGKLGGDFPIMSKPILAAGLRQAGRVLGRASKRRPLQRQRDVLAGVKAASRC